MSSRPGAASSRKKLLEDDVRRTAPASAGSAAARAPSPGGSWRRSRRRRSRRSRPRARSRRRSGSGAGSPPPRRCSGGQLAVAAEVEEGVLEQLRAASSANGRASGTTSTEVRRCSSHASRRRPEQPAVPAAAVLGDGGDEPALLAEGGRTPGQQRDERGRAEQEVSTGQGPRGHGAGYIPSTVPAFPGIDAPHGERRTDAPGARPPPESARGLGPQGRRGRGGRAPRGPAHPRAGPPPLSRKTATQAEDLLRATSTPRALYGFAVLGALILAVLLGLAADPLF